MKVKVKADRDSHSGVKANLNEKKALVLPVIRALELKDFTNGARLCPNKYVETSQSDDNEHEMVINNEFLAWRRFDQYLLSWLLSTVSESLIGQVTDYAFSLEA
ncbi:hypothetical protein Ddye_014880 [Dipteronia dyeriana]|uniref:Uncharacterized protein n=1 Tax=Dipteronia dyeriana TaxID=168575 RepID=A0AAD9U4H9_9ROSI|nr:hypothetical protein Ddye_014880 [Dipteronia dyeriana]